MYDLNKSVKSRVDQLAKHMIEKQLMLATAESCTGGWIAKVITDLPGSSVWFDCGFVTYSNGAKQRMLGVSKQTLELHGAVSEPVVLEMLEGAIRAAPVDLAVAVSGVAGPGGGSSVKPVGTVFIGWMRAGSPGEVKRFQLDGDRDQIRLQTVDLALSGLLDRVKN